MERVRIKGSRLWLQLHARIIVFAGETAAVVWHYDVTDRRAHADNLRRANHALSSEVAERALAESAEKEVRNEVKQRLAVLREVQDKLLRAEQLATLGQGMGTVSHELRNPPGTILSSLYVLRRRLESADLERIHTVIERAERETARCVTIIEHMLDFARMRPMNIETTVVDEWVHGVIAELDVPDHVEQSLVLQRGATVSVDRDSLRQAIVNVVNHAWDAVRANDGGCGVVSLHTQQWPDRIEICVTDDGLGVADERREAVFEPLVSNKPLEIGLGLPLVRQTMERQGGGAQFMETEAGKTTMRLWLPGDEAGGVGP